MPVLSIEIAYEFGDIGEMQLFQQMRFVSADSFITNEKHIRNFIDTLAAGKQLHDFKLSFG